MKKKISFICLAILTTSTFAATGHGYRILDKEIHAAPGSNFHVEDMAPRSQNMLGDPPIYPTQAKTTTTVPDREGKINQSIQVDGYHDFAIRNNTETSIVYEEKVTLWNGVMKNSFLEHVEIAPHGEFYATKHSFGTCQKNQTGDYATGAESFVTGIYGSYSNSTGVLIISK